MKPWIYFRKISQLFFLIIFIYTLWFTTYPLKVKILPELFFLFDPLLTIFTSISERVLIPGLFYSLIFLILTFVFGRFFCGWICPMGTMIDITGKFIPYREKYSFKSGKLRILKYAILSVLLLLAAAGMQFTWIFDPIVTAGRFISLNFIPAVTIAIKQVLVFIINTLGIKWGVYSLYKFLKSNILGINLFYFSNSILIFAYFFTVCVILTLFAGRFWCKYLCPLGAMYAVISKISLLSRKITGCKSCARCTVNCRMDAINKDSSYIKEECILCMDCLYSCKLAKTEFSFIKPDKTGTIEKNDNGGTITRRNFLLLSGITMVSTVTNQPVNLLRKNKTVIRPPGSLKERNFVNRCIRCGNCMKICVTNGLHPAWVESGISGIWTPKLVPETGYCEYSCNLCGTVCPTGAIRKLSLKEKQLYKLGIAEIDKTICLPYAEHKECIVCEEHCPLPEKAIKRIKLTKKGVIIQAPVVDEYLCIGCSICQTKCPARPVRAIRINPDYADI